MTQKDLVTIGIPTYNRCSTLSKAIESVVSQTYLNIEIIIGDNASIDETQAVCESYTSKDNRIRYIRHPDNIGATNNFNKLLELASGKYFMWLSDDDWIDTFYIEECVNILHNDLSYSLVCGKCLLYENKKVPKEDKTTNIESNNSFDRVKTYYKTVGMNSCFYGVMYTSNLKKIGGLQNVIGGDWLLIASTLYLGKIKTLQTTSIHRTLGGTSNNIASLSLAFNIPKRLAIFLYVYVALKVSQETYLNCGKPSFISRLIYSVELGLIIIFRFYIYSFFVKILAPHK